MVELIRNSVTCEIRSVICFLNAKNVKPIDIHRPICEVYGENAKSDSMVRRWVRQLKKGCDQLHDEQRSRRPSVVINELVCGVDEKIKENRKFTINDLAL